MSEAIRFAWHVHDEILLEPLTEPIEQRIAYIRDNLTSAETYQFQQAIFNGLMDGVEWHGVTVHVGRGNTLFGIIGLTSAETYQFQQAIFNKIIKSFRFLDGAGEATASP